MANVTVYVNTDDSSQDLPLGTSGVEFTQFSEGNDRLIFSNGSPEVIDGADIPTQSELISAGVILTGSEVILSEYFLEDASQNELKKAFLMGNVDGRYVLAFDFDAATASEPVLEVWDDLALNTVTGTMLGSGTPSSSFVRGVTTTSVTPGANWMPTANKLAGSSSGNFLFLNDQNGAINIATTLYANIGVIVPASQTIGFSANPVFIVKWLSN